jgi:hypothetical protein
MAVMNVPGSSFASEAATGDGAASGFADVVGETRGILTRYEEALTDPSLLDTHAGDEVEFGEDERERTDGVEGER